MKKKLTLILVIGQFLFLQTLNAQTWSATKRLTWTTGWSYTPELAKDSNDYLYIVWSDYTPGPDEIYYKKSTNGGQTWQTKRLTWTPSYSYVPDIYIDTSDHIHVVWYDLTPGNWEIFYKKSTNGGATWITKRITWNSGESKNPVVSADSSGDIHVLWNDNTFGTYEIFHKKSTDGGATWSAARRLTWLLGYSIFPEVCIDLSDNVHVVWHDLTPGNFEIYYKKSTDGGATWNTKRITWNSGDSMRPLIVTDSNNHLHFVWDDKTPGSQGTIYRRSTDSGDTWETKKIIWDGVRPDLAISSVDNIYLVTQNGGEIYYQKSTNSGQDWTSAKRITWNSGESRNPKVVTDSGEDIHVVWADNTPGNYEIYYKKGIQSPVP
jgi:hypothetical protein